MMRPLISVIIPAYNAEKTIRDCLNAVCNQTYGELEIIVINDGSTDNTAAILDEFQLADSRIRTFTQSNGGVSSARNTGLLNARGDYIAFVDSDDIAESQMIEILYDGIVSSNSDISICGHWGTFVGQRHNQYGSFKQFSRELSGKEALQLLIYDQEIKSYPWDKLYKRELFQGISFPVGRIYEDYAIMYKVFSRAEKIFHTNQPLYQYVHNANSLSQKIDPKGEYHFFQGVKERYYYMQMNPGFIEDYERFKTETVILTFMILKKIIRLDRASLLSSEIEEIRAFFSSLEGFKKGHLDVIRYMKIVLMMRFHTPYSTILRIVKNISTYLYAKVRLSG